MSRDRICKSVPFNNYSTSARWIWDGRSLTRDVGPSSVSDLGKGPRGARSSLCWVKKKKWHNGEKPAVQVNQNRPPSPNLLVVWIASSSTIYTLKFSFIDLLLIDRSFFYLQSLSKKKRQKSVPWKVNHRDDNKAWMHRFSRDMSIECHITTFRNAHPETKVLLLRNLGK